MTTVFDSHKYAKRLMDAGVPAPAADIHAETMMEVMTQISASTADQSSNFSRLDKKIDLLDNKVDRTTAELKVLIEQTRSELIRWVVGLNTVTIGIILSALKFLH